MKCMLEAAHFMVTKTPLGKKKTVSNWFDYECVTTRRNVRKTAPQISEVA